MVYADCDSPILCTCLPFVLDPCILRPELTHCPWFFAAVKTPLVHPASIFTMFCAIYLIVLFTHICLKLKELISEPVEKLCLVMCLSWMSPSLSSTIFWDIGLLRYYVT